MFCRIIVWYNPTKKNYYYKKIKGYYNEYYVGFKNQYEHEVILNIDIHEFMNNGQNTKERVIDKLISILNKIR